MLLATTLLTKLSYRNYVPPLARDLFQQIACGLTESDKGIFGFLLVHGLNVTEGGLKVRKKLLTGAQMYVEQAASWTRELTRMRARGPGDLENAMRLLEREYGIDYWVTWRLRYRLSQVKDIGIGVYARIQAAYQSELSSQLRKHQHELDITRAICGDREPAVVEAQALVGTHKAAPVSPDDRADIGD